MSLAINHPSCKFAPGHFAKLGGMSQKSPGFSMVPNSWMYQLSKHICLYTWLWMMQWFRISKRYLGFQMIKGGRFGLHPSLDLTFCLLTSIHDSWSVRRCFVFSKHRMPKTYLRNAYADWMLVWSMPAMFWAKICQHSSWSFFMKKHWDFWIARQKGVLLDLIPSLLWDKPWWFFSNRCIDRLQSHLEIAIDQKIGTGRVSFLSLFRRLVVSHLKVKIDGICRDWGLCHLYTTL